MIFFPHKMPYRLPCSKPVLQWIPILCHYVCTHSWAFQQIQVVKANKKRGTFLKLVRWGRSEDHKGGCQEVEGSKEITEISPCLKLTVNLQFVHLILSLENGRHKGRVKDYTDPTIILHCKALLILKAVFCKAGNLELKRNTWFCCIQFICH